MYTSKRNKKHLSKYEKVDFSFLAPSLAVVSYMPMFRPHQTEWLVGNLQEGHQLHGRADVFGISTDM